MYDTLCLRLPQSRVPKSDLLAEIPTYLDRCKTITDNTTGCPTIIGTLGNLQVSVTDYQAKITNSLCKWHFGNNLQTLTRADVQDAIEKLSDTLHQPIDLADVTRLDAGANFAVTRPCEAYYKHLSELSRYKRLLQPDAIYYNQNTKQLCFYDKLKEYAKSKPTSPPPEPLPDYLLRYEFRAKQKVPQLYGQLITGADLYNAEFYNKTLQMWRDNYYSIKKIADASLDFDYMTSRTKLFEQWCIAYCVQNVLGSDNLLSQVAIAKKEGRLGKVEAKRWKDKIIKANSPQQGVSLNSEEVEELDTKVEEVVQTLLS